MPLISCLECPKAACRNSAQQIEPKFGLRPCECSSSWSNGCHLLEKEPWREVTSGSPVGRVAHSVYVITVIDERSQTPSTNTVPKLCARYVANANGIMIGGISWDEFRGLTFQCLTETGTRKSVSILDTLTFLILPSIVLRYSEHYQWQFGQTV